jgi:hypothetical protein
MKKLSNPFPILLPQARRLLAAVNCAVPAAIVSEINLGKRPSSGKRSARRAVGRNVPIADPGDAALAEDALGRH